MFKPDYLYVFFYNIFLFLYHNGIRLSSLWNSKAKSWLEGRSGIFEKIQAAVGESPSTIAWFHCSSLGEFEQGRPVIEKIRSIHPQAKVLITFFSPSGFEVRKDYNGADYIFYLPFDGRTNAARFIGLIKPSIVVFIKYDLWYYYLREIEKRNIPCLLVSAVFRPNQIFFRNYGYLQKEMLACFTHIFVQNKQSQDLLHSIGIGRCTVSGDTRFDRVIETAGNFTPVPYIDEFIGTGKCIVAGSSWKQDEELLYHELTELNRYGLKLIIAPHEINEGHLSDLKKLFIGATRFSEVMGSKTATAGSVLLIDNIGMLSRLYRYAHVAYIGGGFTKDGIHNILEAAVYGKPVVFGPNYEKYREARDLIRDGGAKSFSGARQLREIFVGLLENQDQYELSCKASKNYVWKNKGATEEVINYIEVNRLLTNW